MKKKLICRAVFVLSLMLVCILGLSVTAGAQTHRTCQVSGCENSAVCGSSYCSEHKCKVEGCSKKAGSNGYCSSHKTASSRKDVTEEADSKTCQVNGCSKTKAKNSNYCSRHTCTKKNCYRQKEAEARYCSEHLKDAMPDCDDYDSYEDFMDDWDGCMPDGSDAEDYWEDW